MVAPETGDDGHVNPDERALSCQSDASVDQIAYATTSRSSFKCKCNLLHLRPRGERACRAQLCFCPTGYLGNRCSTKSPISVRLQ